MAAACFAALAFALSLPQQAEAYPCDSQTTVRLPQLAEASSDECGVPEKLKRSEAPPAREKKKEGDLSGLAVFVLAIAAALLIPIGRNGMPHGDPFGHDPTYEPKP